MGVIIGVVFLSFREKEKDENTENSKIKNWARKHKRSVKIIFLAYSFFLISITVLSLVKITYINRSIAYYKQLQSIASPYLTTDEEEKFNSRFSQIQNKEHYIQIINELKKIIGDKNQNLQKSPDFIF